MASGDELPTTALKVDVFNTTAASCSGGRLLSVVLYAKGKPETLWH
jgi:hypothetical protein